MKAEKIGHFVPGGYVGIIDLPYLWVSKGLRGFKIRRVPENGSKVDIEWAIKLDGKAMSVYNYKDGPNYIEGSKIKDIEKWHVGGQSVNEHDVEQLKKYIISKII